MNDKTVTVIITTFHRPADLVKKALDSVLAQTVPAAEILIIDDNEPGSVFSGPVASLCAAHENVRCVRQGENRGAGAARNRGVREASGRFIAFLDDDDVWLPRKLEKQLAVFDGAGEDLGLVYCHGIQQEEGGPSYEYYNRYSDRDPSYPVMLGHDAIGSTSGPLIRKSAFEELGGFWEELPACEDFELWIRFAKSRFRIDCADEKLFIYLIHKNERVSAKRRNLHRAYRMIYRRYRQDLKRYPAARVRRLNRIIGSRSGLTPAVLAYALERQWVRIRHHAVLAVERPT